MVCATSNASDLTAHTVLHTVQINFQAVDVHKYRYIQTPIGLLIFWGYRPCLRCTMWGTAYAVWSEPLLIVCKFYECWATDWTSFGVSKSESKLVKMPYCWKSRHSSLRNILGVLKLDSLTSTPPFDVLKLCIMRVIGNFNSFCFHFF